MGLSLIGLGSINKSVFEILHETSIMFRYTEKKSGATFREWSRFFPY